MSNNYVFMEYFVIGWKMIMWYDDHMSLNQPSSQYFSFIISLYSKYSESSSPVVFMYMIQDC